jgi:antitoxin ParD1/3/4
MIAPMRTALNISLPEATRGWVEDQVRKHGYGTVSEYIRQLLREEQKRQLREEVDRNVLEALDSGEATPMTRKDWQDIEREGLKRARTKKTRTAR